MSQLDSGLATVEIRAVVAGEWCSDFTCLLCGSVQVVTFTPVTVTTSLLTITNSLCRVRISHLRWVLRSTDWCGWRCEVGLHGGQWECTFHMWHMVIVVTCLELSLAVLSERVRATLQ